LTGQWLKKKLKFFETTAGQVTDMLERFGVVQRAPGQGDDRAARLADERPAGMRVVVDKDLRKRRPQSKIATPALARARHFALLD
jgi:hypothetical protein